jgi:hypothetical protein
MPPTYDELLNTCDGWLKNNTGKLSLSQPLFLVTGWTDESASCWTAAPNCIEFWGNKIFSNWAAKRTILQFPDEQAGFKFPAGFQVGGEDVGGETMNDFRDFGDLVRATIRGAVPPDARDGEYDVVCHSMGGLDTFAALVPLTAARPLTPAEQLPAARHYVTLDTPFRGVPNIGVIEPSTGPRHTQGEALKVGSPLLQDVVDKRASLIDRTQTLSCYGVDTASFVEVPKSSSDLMLPLGSSQLFFDDNGNSVKGRLSYIAPRIPGAVHSGGGGICASLITVVSVFLTLTGDMVS